MLVVCVSDTHMIHEKLSLPEADLLIHAGDATNTGTVSQVRNFFEWLKKLPHKHKIYVPGNHDTWVAENELLVREELASNGINLLVDRMIDIEGKKFYGMPWTPRYGWFRYMLIRRSEELQHKVASIPEDLDVLITHGPRYGILDENEIGFHQGCELLAQHIVNVAPKNHVFGHIHEAHGYHEETKIRYHNVSISNGSSRNPATIFEI